MVSRRISYMQSISQHIHTTQNIPLDPSSYDAIYNTMSFVKQQI